jgi:hypothetical protein
MARELESDSDETDEEEMGPGSARFPRGTAAARHLLELKARGVVDAAAPAPAPAPVPDDGGEGSSGDEFDFPTLRAGDGPTRPPPPKKRSEAQIEFDKILNGKGKPFVRPPERWTLLGGYRELEGGPDNACHDKLASRRPASDGLPSPP